VGFILLALTVLIGKGMPALKFYKTENMRMEVKPTITAMVKIILKVYFIYLIAGIVLYKVAGMPLFDAINHAMTTLACGGMSVKNAGIGFYNNPRVELASIILMILGAINMVLHYEIIKGNLKEVTKNIEVKVSVFVFFACLVVILNDRLLYAIYPTMKEVYRAGGYLVISAMSTTGFTIMPKAEIAGLTGFSTVFLIIIMVIGGGACSAAGGIKLLRLGMVVKAFYSKIKKLALPEEESTPTKIHYVEDVALDRGDLNMVFTFVALYIVIFITSGIIVSLFGYGVINAFFETASALGTVGLTCGITSITMPTIVKVVYIFDMWVGRLEILPALIMLLYFINKIKIATVGR
jgi:trk system potassium uptake protein TrkH